ncbi:hypothetical protein J4416_00625 [Candidatus Pacearchaeota archaeon]|nr:hypothetical protein [Candidatus Pacearchaeota archaeon]
MHQISQKIISLFKNSELTLPTSKILEGIETRYNELKVQAIEKNDLESKRKIAISHRRILHHLNKLVETEILNLEKYGKKGEKFFSLNIKDNEEIVEISPKYKKRVIISRPLNPLMPIEGYEQKEIVLKYEPATWIDRLNSIVVFSEKIEDIDIFYRLLIENLFPIVNDTIHLENFESVINRENPTNVLDKINDECVDYGKLLSVGINLSAIKNQGNFKEILELIARKKIDNINFIFGIGEEDLEKEEIKIVIDFFLRAGKLLYLKNKKIHEAPYFVGRAGPYCILNKDWQFAEELRKNLFCLGCSQSSVIVDVNKFYNEEGLNSDKFSRLIFNITKSMLFANSIQRRKTDEYFKGISVLNKKYEPEFLGLSRNYIRLWNFGLNEPGKDNELILNMINEAKKRADRFAVAEETIYKSCGMTTRFRMAFAPAFEKATNLSPKKYSKLSINNINDLSNKEIKSLIKFKESYSSIFNGGDECTFHYNGEFDSEKILTQIKHIISEYNLPLFNYSFEGVKGNTKLAQFIK